MNTNHSSAARGCGSRLWKLTRGYRRYFVLSLLLTPVGVFLTYMMPLLVSFTVDSVIGTKPISLPGPLALLVEHVGGRDFLRQNLWVLAVSVLVLSIFNGVVFYLRRRWNALGGEGLSCALRNQLFRSLSGATCAWIKSHQTGDLIQRCTSDVETVRRFAQLQMMELVRTLVMMGIALAIMIPLNLWLTLTACSLLPVLLLFSFFYSRGVRRVFAKADEADGAMTSALQENLTGMRVVRAFARQKAELDKFTHFNQEYRRIYLRLGKLMSGFWGIGDFLSYTQITLVVLVGTVMAAQGTISLGTMILFSTYCSMFTFPVRQLGRVLADMIKANVAMHRLDEILTAPQEEEPGKALCPTLKGQVTFEHVDFVYPDDPTSTPVLRDISFTAQPGQTIGILGSTGSGKSSLVHLMQRLFCPTAGHILLDGIDLLDIRQDALRRQVGMVLQEPFLFSCTIGQNIAMADPSASQDICEDAARTACVHDVILQFREGYDTMVGERGVTLSGGQKQRVAIARMLVQNAPICVFDDSLSAVDAETDSAIRAALKQRDTGTTFLISHRISTLRDADLILVLENGCITQRGTHAQLQAQEGLYRRICSIQNELDDPAATAKEVTSCTTN